MSKLTFFALTFTAILAFSAASSYTTTIVTEMNSLDNGWWPWREGLDNGFWPRGTDGLHKNNVKSINDLRIPIGEGLDNKNHVKSTNGVYPHEDGLDNGVYRHANLRIPYGEGLDNGVYPHEDGLGNQNNVKSIINSGLVKRQHLRS